MTERYTFYNFLYTKSEWTLLVYFFVHCAPKNVTKKEEISANSSFQKMYSYLCFQWLFLSHFFHRMCIDNQSFTKLKSTKAKK